MTRMGKDVVDLVDVGLTFDDCEVLRDVTWRLAPGERTGILGVNGAGKSTLLGLIAGTVAPSSGRIKRGKTVKVATLTQHVDLLDEVWDDRVSDVIAQKKTSYAVGDKELSPSQLLERLGFTSAQLSTPVRDLSGGQQRRLQLLLILLDEPNLLILDEPTNDMDTDMLAAIEDLLDSWPGTLIVVSHDRYLLERVTDNQYAILGGTLRHLPRGVDEYLQLKTSAPVPTQRQRTHQREVDTEPLASQKQTAQAAPLSGAERRMLEKECSAIERKLAKQNEALAGVHERMLAYDQADYAGLASLSSQVQQLEAEISALELRWLEVSDVLE
jgi:ATP-binding cassette subfamily F protein uup